MRRWGIALVIIVGLVALGWWSTARPISMLVTITPNLPIDVDQWIADREDLYRQAYGLVPDTEQRIHWQVPGARTEYAIVYIHGFSATRQEIAPTAELVADRLGANLFETRLSGHGHVTEPMAGVTAEGWIQNTVTALTIGEAIGDKLVVISTSTGSTLAMALDGFPHLDNVEVLVMISPNFAPADPSAQWITRPFGKLLMKLAAGDTRTWQAHNDQQEIYWTTSYPSEAVIEVMRLVDYVQAKLPAAIDQQLLMFVSPDDTVVSPAAARAAFDAIEAPRKEWISVAKAGDPSSHILAGDILSPDTTDWVVSEIIEFVNGASARPALSAAPE